MSIHPRWRWSTISLTLLGLALVLAWNTGAAGQEVERVDFHHDFRQAAPLPPELTLVNDPAGEFCRFEPEGLRVVVPKTSIYQRGDGVGVRADVRLRDDFEITADLEVLQIDTPSSGAGAGLALYCPTVSGDDAVLLGRLIDTRGRPIIMCSRQRGALQSKDLTWDRHPTPNDDTRLRLRLVRRGAALSYQFAPAGRDDFTELQRCEFSAEDIKLVRFTAVNNRTHCTLDVRLLDLRLRTGADVATPVATAEPAAPARRRWLPIIGVLLGLLAVIGAALLLRRARATPGRPPS